MNTHKLLAFGAALLLGGFVHITNSNTAAAMAIAGNSVSAVAGISDDETALEQVRHRRYRWKYHGP